MEAHQLGPSETIMATTGFEWITIEGFKSILSIQELPLRGINILVDANGSGKSIFF